MAKDSPYFPRRTPNARRVGNRVMVTPPKIDSADEADTALTGKRKKAGSIHEVTNLLTGHVSEAWKGAKAIGDSKIYIPTKQVSQHHKDVLASNVRELERAEIKAGVSTEIDPHCGRNWLITRLAEQGAHLKEIGRLLGQDDVSTILDVYMKVRAGRTTTLMEKVNGSLDHRADGYRLVPHDQ